MRTHGAYSIPVIASLCPPSSLASSRLVGRVARRTAIRLGRTRLALASPLLRRAVPGGANLLHRIVRTVDALPPTVRQEILHGPDLRGFLGEAEVWLSVAHLAARRDIKALFDRVSRTEHLVLLLPSGRIDPGFARRSGRFARVRLQQAVSDLAGLLLGLRLAFPRAEPIDLPVELREEPEQGRPRHRVDLGTFCGPVGPLAIEAPRRRLPSRLRARLSGRTLRLRPTGGRDSLFTAAGSRFRFPCPGGGRDAARLRLVRRRTIPGTTILLAPALRSTPRHLSVGRDTPGLAKRLARALRILRLAWPEGCREVLRRTSMVVPIREPGLVSYSLASRPGVSYLNVQGKTTLELADDLLHETAHHLLHDLQEIEDLLARGSSTQEVQAFASPWRGTLRPLHGILHGTYTFLFRAELFGRILRAARVHPRLVTPMIGRGGTAWVRRERRRELRMIARALRDLEAAARSGLLTGRGRELLGGMRAWHTRLR